MRGTYRNAVDEPVTLRERQGMLVLEEDPPLVLRRVGPKTIAAVSKDGEVIQRFVTLTDPDGCVAYIYFLGRAFRHEAVCSRSAHEAN